MSLAVAPTKVNAYTRIVHVASPGIQTVMTALSNGFTCSRTRWRHEVRYNLQLLAVIVAYNFEWGICCRLELVIKLRSTCTYCECSATRRMRNMNI